MDPSELPLRDIHVPDPISWWPPAVGWWFVAAVVLAAAVWVWRYRKKRRSVGYRMRRELTTLRQSFARDNDVDRLVQQGSLLLRRACLSGFPREQVAGLTGAAYLAFIDRLAEADFLPERRAALLRDGPYRPSADIDAGEYLELLTHIADRLTMPMESR
jgi:hypothetical protein